MESRAAESNPDSAPRHSSASLPIPDYVPPSPHVLNIAGIDEDAIADGPGLRFVVFVQGCLHHCPGCHNPQTHQFGCGENWSVDDLLACIRRNPLQSGATFTGGDPLFQAGPLAELAERIKAERPVGFDIAIYTGFCFEAILDRGSPDQLRLLRAADILVDGPFVLAKKDRRLRFRGSSNQRILDLHKSLTERRAVWTSDPDWIDGDPCHPAPESAFSF